LLTSSIGKSRATPPQAQQSLKQRKENLAGSFSIKKNIHAKNVAIIDDVVTTGSTAEEIAKILKINGVDYVQVWGIAHTL
jgi:predicted amidophosphoribosyltransferase